MSGTSPFLRDAWYCGGWSADLTEKPVGRTMLGDYFVLFRGSHGHAVAMSGRCPHRFAPLDRGRVHGSTIICPYHGLVFDSDGRCVRNPHGDGHVPDRARLTAYPVVERDGAIWVWMGVAERADTDAVPRAAWLSDPAFVSIHGYLTVRANYQLIIDNLLDLTHAPFLHAATVGAPPDSVDGLLNTFRKDGSTIHSRYEHPAMPALPIYANLFHGVGRFTAEMRWSPPCNLSLWTAMSALAGATEPASVTMPSVHYLVPETDTTTHYFFAMGRDAAIDDAAETRRMAEIAGRAFSEEDEPMIQACQHLMGGEDFFSLQPVILRTDTAGVQARRILSQLIARERAAQPEVHTAA